VTTTNEKLLDFASYGHWPSSGTSTGHGERRPLVLELALATTSDESVSRSPTWRTGSGVLLQQQSENDDALALFRSKPLHLERPWKPPPDGARTQQSRHNKSPSGSPRFGARLIEDSITIARELDDGARLAAALTSLSHCETDAGNLDRADSALREALQNRSASWVMNWASPSICNPWPSLVLRGTICRGNDLLLSTLPYVIASGHLESLATTSSYPPPSPRASGRTCAQPDSGVHQKASGRNCQCPYRSRRQRPGAVHGSGPRAKCRSGSSGTPHKTPVEYSLINRP